MGIYFRLDSVLGLDPLVMNPLHIIQGIGEIPDVFLCSEKGVRSRLQTETNKINFKTNDRELKFAPIETATQMATKQKKAPKT